MQGLYAFAITFSVLLCLVKFSTPLHTMKRWLPTLLNLRTILTPIPVGQVEDAFFPIASTKALEYSLQGCDWITFSPLNVSLGYNVLIAQALVTWPQDLNLSHSKHTEYKWGIIVLPEDMKISAGHAKNWQMSSSALVKQRKKFQVSLLYLPVYP